MHFSSSAELERQKGNRLPAVAVVIQVLASSSHVKVTWGHQNYETRASRFSEGLPGGRRGTKDLTDEGGLWECFTLWLDRVLSIPAPDDRSDPVGEDWWSGPMGLSVPATKHVIRPRTRLLGLVLGLASFWNFWTDVKA